MGQIAEDSLWYKGKSEVLREFSKNRSAILSTVAAKNFSAIPGFAIEALTDIEIDSKLKLTEHNQKIMSEAIDRELKALGLENDIAIKQAMMAWELEKIGLFSDLQKEFSDKELLRSLSGEDIEALMIAQEIREVGVTLAKVAIEIDVEEVKRDIANQDLLPLPYEESLAAARVAAAEKKLTAIPYILAALAAQSAVLVSEETIIFPARQLKAESDKAAADKTVTDVLPKMVEKSAATAAMTVKQTEMLSPLILKAAASVALADAMMDQLNNHRAIAEEKVAQANEKVKSLNGEIVLQGKELTLESKKIDIALDRAALELRRAEAKLDIIDKLRVQLGNIRTAMDAETLAEGTYISTIGTNEVSVKKTKLEQVDAARYVASAAELQSQTNAVSNMASDDYAHTIDMANATADAKVSEKLIHLLA